MRITANGYERDHGANDILEYTLDDNFCFDITASPPGAQITASASITLNGKYWLRIQIPQGEIGRMFYATHRDKSLSDIVGMLAEFKREDDKWAAEQAKRDVARKASQIKRRA